MIIAGDGKYNGHDVNVDDSFDVEGPETESTEKYHNGDWQVAVLSLQYAIDSYCYTITITVDDDRYYQVGHSRI